MLEISKKLVPFFEGEVPILNVSYKPQKISPKFKVSIITCGIKGCVTHLFAHEHLSSQW